jgi:hypothetical protein
MHSDYTKSVCKKKIRNKSLFKRIHGVQINCIQGENIYEFFVPYNLCKINCIEIVGGSNCDKIDLEVYDNANGTISGIPNLKLNQFGFSVNVCKDFYEQKSEFDADLILGMKLEVHYLANIAGLIGVNFILNELK